MDNYWKKLEKATKANAILTQKIDSEVVDVMELDKKMVQEEIRAGGVTITRYASLSLITEELESLKVSEKDNENDDDQDNDFVDVQSLHEATFWLTDTQVSLTKVDAKMPTSFASSESKGVTSKKLLKAIGSTLLPRKLSSVEFRDDIMAQSIGYPSEDDSVPELPDKAPHPSAFVKINLTSPVNPDISLGDKNNNNDEDSSYYLHSAFVSSDVTGQLLKMRISDGAFFLSASGVSREYKKVPKVNQERYLWPEMEFDLEVKEKVMLEKENPVYETIRICNPPLSFSFSSYWQSSVIHSAKLASLGVNVVELSLAALLQKGVLIMKDCKEEPNRIILYLAPWLSFEKDLEEVDNEKDEEAADKQSTCDLV